MLLITVLVDCRGALINLRPRSGQRPAA